MLLHLISIQDGTLITSPQQSGNLLALFYKDPKRWAYTFQVSGVEHLYAIDYYTQETFAGKKLANYELFVKIS